MSEGEKKGKKSREIEDDFDGFGAPEPEFDDEESEEEESAPAAVASPGGVTWQAANSIVQKVRPVPWLLWVIVRAVYGKSAELGEPQPVVFSPVSSLIRRAAQDRTLAPARPESAKDDDSTSLAEAVQLIGGDVAGAICFMHAVCRRIASTLPEKIWKPIIDDALLRAHLGYHVGELTAGFGPGRGMLAGFSGRSGLAIQIASGSLEQAQQALSGLASGIEIGQVCRGIYGCDPLQVAALSLISGGCNRDIAMGIASFSNAENTEVPVGSEQHRWLTVFGVIEHVRMNRKEMISSATWKQLEYDPAGINDLMTRVQQVQRKGHGWRWLTQPLVTGDATPPKEPGR